MNTESENKYNLSLICLHFSPTVQVAKSENSKEPLLGYYPVIYPLKQCVNVRSHL